MTRPYSKSESGTARHQDSTTAPASRPLSTVRSTLRTSKFVSKYSVSTVNAAKKVTWGVSVDETARLADDGGLGQTEQRVGCSALRISFLGFFSVLFGCETIRHLKHAPRPLDSANDRRI